jgi:predicted methyltransferase
MKLLKLVMLSALITISASASSAENEYSFEKGQRAQQDVLRDSKSKGPDIVNLVGIKANMQVLDILGGGGYYSEILSDKVGKGGSVYLHNNKAYMPYVEKELNARLHDNRLNNVIRWDKEVDDLALKKESFDAVFFVLGYHDMYHTAEGWSINKDDFLKQLGKSLKIGGKLLVIDHSAVVDSGTKHSQDLHRIDAGYVKKELAKKGYKLIKESNLLANSNDDRMSSPFSKEMRRKTDRFVLLFEKK